MQCSASTKNKNKINMGEFQTIGNLVQMSRGSSVERNMPRTLQPNSVALTPAVSKCIERYKDPQTFLSIFTPAKQYAYTKDLRRVFMGDAPSLGVISKAWGENITEAWLELHLIDLGEFSGVKDKLSTSQLDSISQVIMATWGYYKVSEMMLFFLQFKSGKYGKFYGSVDSMVITEALRKFDKERCQIIDRYNREEEERQKKLQEEAADIARAKWREHVRRCCLPISDYFKISKRYDLTPEEMEEVGWLFNMGYEPQQLAKERSEGAKLQAIKAKKKADLDALIAQLQRQRDALED